MHDAGAGLDHGHLRLAHDRVDQLGAAARDEHVDEAAGLHQLGRAVATELVDRLHRIRRQADALERLLQQLDEHAVGVLGGAAAAQHDGVAALEREGGDVDGHVGPGLVDGADDAEGHAHLGEAQAVRQGRAAQGLADRVGQGDDLADGGGEALEARRVEPEPVEQAVAQAVLAPVREVELVGREDARGRPLDGDGDRVEAGILLVRRRLRERDRRGAGGAELVVERQGGDGLRHAASLLLRLGASSLEPGAGRGARESLGHVGRRGEEHGGSGCGGQLRGRDLRARSPGADSRGADVAELDAREVVLPGHVVDPAGARLVRRARVERVDVAQQHEQVGLQTAR